MTITALPTPPSRDDPANFASRADTFLAALPDFATEANALASAVNADEIAAAASASSASTSASNASASASAASTSASNASSSASSAASSASSAAASYDAFDDRYLGSKTSNPTLDNDGNALLTGALYWNSVANEMRVYNGSIWVATYLPAGSYITLNGTETLTNKTINGSNNTITNVSLSAGVTGTLPVANGGTGATSLTANRVLLGNGTSALQTVAPGSNGNVLTSNGTTWVSSAPAAGLIGQTDSTWPPGGNTFLGFGAGAVNTASGNTFIGYEAGLATTSGGTNVAVGFGALSDNTTGSSNVAIGMETMTTSTTALSNTAVGSGALQNLTTGGSNTAVGTGALLSNTTGQQNVAIGSSCLDGNTTGYQNVAISPFALDACTSGYNNIVIGRGAAPTVTTGNGNVCLGYACDTSIAAAVNQIVVGPSVVGSGDSTVTLGSSAGKIYNAYTVNATWTQTSDGTMKNIIGPDDLGLSFIKRLNPIKFTWKPQNQLPKDHPYYAEKNEKDTQTVIHGFIAQEVKAALDAEGCSTFNGWDQGPDGIQAISREMFISPLVKAVQELAARVEALEAQLKDDQRG